MAIKTAHFISLFLAIFAALVGIEGVLNKDKSFFAMCTSECARIFDSLAVPRSTCDHHLEMRNYAFKLNSAHNLELQRENREVPLSTDFKECEDFKLGFCHTNAMESYLTKESEMGKRIDKLERRVETVLRGMKALSGEAENQD
jgi:hypothetical protein